MINTSIFKVYTEIIYRKWAEDMNERFYSAFVSFFFPFDRWNCCAVLKIRCNVFGLPCSMCIEQMMPCQFKSVKWGLFLKKNKIFDVFSSFASRSCSTTFKSLDNMKFGLCFCLWTENKSYHVSNIEAPSWTQKKTNNIRFA